MAVEIHTVVARAELAVRKEPHWATPLGTNQSLGFHKIDVARGSWIARAKIDGRLKVKALGKLTPTFGFKEARDAARAWFANVDRGITSDDRSVEDACKKYVED